MRWSTVALLALLLTAVAMAGCMQEDGRHESSASIADDGSGETSDIARARCGTGGVQLSGLGLVDEGLVTVQVLDGRGQTVFQQEVRGAIDLQGELLEGEPGTWTVRADGGPDFVGDYSFTIACV